MSSFPTIMSLKKIPPVKGKDYKENFIPLFFERLLDMKLASESQIMNVFIDDAKFLPIKRKEITSIDATVS